MNLYVSNLAYSLTDEELRNEFAAYGTVSHARVVQDRETNRSRGFGFVDMPDDSEARTAIEGLNNATVGGRTMRVVEARPREDQPPRRDGGGSAPSGPRRDSTAPRERNDGGGGGYRRDDDRRSPKGNWKDRDERNSGKAPVRRDWDERRSGGERRISRGGHGDFDDEF